MALQITMLLHMGHESITLILDMPLLWPLIVVAFLSAYPGEVEKPGLKFAPVSQNGKSITRLLFVLL